nr:myosin-17 isoform X1 [Tanacetum cinerariifolium]
MVFLRAGQMPELDARMVEYLGNAAKIVQRQMHAYIAHTNYILVRKAAIQLANIFSMRVHHNGVLKYWRGRIYDGGYDAEKTNWVDYVCKTENDVKNNYLSGLYDAIMKCDYDGSKAGMGTILPASFTGGTRIWEKMRVLLLHLVFTLTGLLTITGGLDTALDLKYFLGCLVDDLWASKKQTDLVRRSTITQIVPAAVFGNLVTKSIVIFSHYHCGISG